MRFAVNYPAFRVRVLFDVRKNPDYPGLALTVIEPLTHKCIKDHKTIQDIAAHVSLSNKASQVLILSYILNEKCPDDTVEFLEFTVSKNNIQCDCN